MRSNYRGKPRYRYCYVLDWRVMQHNGSSDPYARTGPPVIIVGPGIMPQYRTPAVYGYAPLFNPYA